MNNWTELSDDELKAKLQQRLGEHHPDVEYLMARRDDEDSHELIEQFLEEVLA